MAQEGTALDEEYDDPNETLRLIVFGVGIVANLVIVYWQLKDTAEMIEMRARMRHWWERTWAAPERWRKQLARMEAETVFEAMTVLDEGGAA